jgi:hypothetical protein
MKRARIPAGKARIVLRQNFLDKFRIVTSPIGLLNKNFWIPDPKGFNLNLQLKSLYEGKSTIDTLYSETLRVSPFG